MIAWWVYPLAPVALLAAWGWKLGARGANHVSNDFWSDEWEELPPLGSDLVANARYLAINSGFRPPLT